jgi:hypothetical protein
VLSAICLTTFSGLLAGTGLFVVLHQALATFGPSLPSTAALLVSVGSGVLIGCSVPGRLPRRLQRASGWLILAVWVVLCPTLLVLVRGGMHALPVGVFEQEPTAFLLLLACGLVLLTPASAAATLLWRAGTCSDSRECARTDGAPALLLAGVAVGLGGAPAVLGPWVGVEVAGHVVAAIAALLFWRELLGAAEPIASDPDVEHVRQRSGPVSRASLLWVGGLSLLVGLELPVVGRMALRLVSGSAEETLSLFAGVLLGIAGGLAWGRRSGRVPHRLRADGLLIAAVIAAAWPALVLAVTPVRLNLMLWGNAHLSIVSVLQALRWVLLTGTVIPLGVAWGRTWSSTHQGRQDDDRVLTIVGVTWGLAGVVLMLSLWPRPTDSLLVLPLGALCVAVARVRLLETALVSRPDWICGGLTVLLVGGLPLWRAQERPDLPARLLFSTQVFAAHHAGIDRGLLPQLDDSRLVALSEGRSATWTVWRHRGAQLVLRRNGIPEGSVSTEPAVCPQFAGDMLVSLLPMVVHERAADVVMLGLGSTAAVTACLACPAQSLTCVEGDTDLIRLTDEVIAREAGVHPLEDDRVQLVKADPTLAVLTAARECDVLISNGGRPSLLHEAPRFTQEFYREVRRHLRPGGVFAQRLHTADFGRGAVEGVLRTLQSVFPCVTCLESAAGEFVLLARRDDGPMIDESLLARCETPHVRRLMAQSGWDWSVLLSLAGIAPKHVRELTAAGETPQSISRGRMIYSLPREVMRWGPKRDELRGLFAEHGSTMLSWLGDSARVSEVGQRLADMREQQELIARHPDRFWAYRATIKERLQERPRSAIVPVNHELKRSLHPEDERRKEYLEVLGEAAAAESLNPEQITRLNQFVEPYDPLVSYFLHLEAAQLYSRCTPEDVATRLAHLRYSVYFGPAQDVSLRNVVAALDVMLAHPELIPEPTRRWDELNSLLEILKERSGLRIQTDQTVSSFELVDARSGIDVTRRALSEMHRLRESAGIAAEDWQSRRTVLERLLIRPLWTYHAQQSERLAKAQAQRRRVAEAAEPPTESR